MWEKHNSAYEEGEKSFLAKQAEAQQRLEEVKVKIKTIHEKATAAEKQQMDLDVEVEEPVLAEASANLKKMRDAMSSAMTTLKENVEDAYTSPRRKTSTGGQPATLPPTPAEPFH